MFLIGSQLDKRYEFVVGCQRKRGRSSLVDLPGA